MADIIVGEKVINKLKQKGVITAVDERFMYIDYGTRTVRTPLDAFEKEYIKYENQALQSGINASLEEAMEDGKKAEAEKKAIVEKTRADHKKIQDQLSATHFRISVMSASIRLDPAPLTLTGVRKKDQATVLQIFSECDKDALELYDSVTPDLKYLRNTPQTKSKYCIGFLTSHLDTYVFRAFSRNDVYKRSESNGTTVLKSDTTEVLRMMNVNGKLYCFSKNLACAGGYLVNTKAHGNWHVSELNGTLLLNDVIRKCDCGYLNDYISEQNIECLQYVKLLFPAFVDNKAEIVFKNKQFLSTRGIDDISAYLSEYSS